MNTLPAERDLPPAARDAARARVVAATQQPPAPRRWVPVAAAAGLLAVVGASVAGVAAYRSDPAPAPAASPSPSPSPSPSASPTGPDRDDLAARCIRSSGADSGPVEIDTSDSRVLVLFRDRYGYQLEVGNPGFAAECTASPDGQEVIAGGYSGSGGPRGRNLTYLKGREGPIELQGYGGVELAGHVPLPTAGERVVFYASGRVSRDVARVVITWPGKKPVTAAVEGPRFLARVPGRGRTDARQEPGDRPDLIVAYDAAGHELGRTN
ncbi:MAG TPA: hypothetical protein VI357_28055 [Mycobacteriales bacterium]